VDPLHEILELKDKYDFRLHADAAYGGYFILADNLGEETRKAYQTLIHTDSIVIDPHKHGLQPYGCGCILFRDPSVGRFYKHDSPYTYFTSPELHLGEISLECSRPGASAVALWATQKLLPLIPGGKFAEDLSSCRRAAMKLFDKISKNENYKIIFPPQLDIVIWSPKGKTGSEISAKSRQLFTKAEEKNIYLALFQYPSQSLKEVWPDVDLDTPYVTCLRSCLMKPEHENWVDKIWETINNI